MAYERNLATKYEFVGTVGTSVGTAVKHVGTVGTVEIEREIKTSFFLYNSYGSHSSHVFNSSSHTSSHGSHFYQASLTMSRPMKTTVCDASARGAVERT